MGTFHTVCTLLHIIGKRFRDPALEDICMETKLVVEGSVPGMHEGHKYNQAVRSYKLLYEGFNRLAWKHFLSSYNDPAAIHDMSKSIEALISDVNEENFEEVLNYPAVKRVLDAYEEHLDFLRNENGALSKFWMSFMDMVDILLNIIRASREGDWQLHLSSIRAMIP